jgi:predicted transcriptional regulator
MTSITIEIPSDLYDLLKQHLENSHDDLYQLIAEAIASKLHRQTQESNR